MAAPPTVAAHRGWFAALLVAAIMVAAAGLAADPAAAGTYHVYGCRTPAGAAAPTAGWGVRYDSASVLNFPVNTCSAGGGLILDATGSPGGAAGALPPWVGWSFSAPPGTTVVRSRVWRFGTLGARETRDGVAVPQWALVATAPNDPGHAAETFGTTRLPGAADTQATFGNPDSPFDARNLVGFDASPPEPNVLSRVFVALQCVVEDGCTQRARLTVAATDVILRDDDGPRVAGLFGEVDLASGPTVQGAVGVSVAASDVGSGIARGFLVVDGQTQPAAPFTGPGSCRASTDSEDGRPAYDETVPCPPLGSTTIPWDTTPLADGPHRVELWIEDAAGNRTLASQGTVTVTHPAPEVPQRPLESPAAERGPVNGSIATDRARLTAWWEDGKRRPVALSRGWDARRPATLRGLLSDPDGRPIAAATLDVVSTSSAYGAAPARLGSATTAADGSFSFPVPLADGSAAISLRWRARLLDRQPAESTGLSLAVSAGSSFRASRRSVRRGDTVRFTGRVVGRAGVRLRVPVDLYAYSGGRWLNVRSTVTDAVGRWTIAFKFRSSTGRIPFRARVQQGVLYPYEPGYSTRIRLRVR